MLSCIGVIDTSSAILKQKTGVSTPAFASLGVADQSRVHVCDLQSTFSTQPFMRSELPLIAPEPL